MQKKTKKFFFISHNIIQIGCVKFSLLSGEYMSSAVNVLTNSHNILHITKSNFFKLNILIGDQ